MFWPDDTGLKLLHTLSKGVTILEMAKRRGLKAKFWVIQCLLEEPTKKRKS